MNQIDINKIHNEYCDFLHINKKDINIITVFDIPTNSGVTAKFVSTELQESIYKLHVNTKILNYNSIHQKAIFFS